MGHNGFSETLTSEQLHVCLSLLDLETSEVLSLPFDPVEDDLRELMVEAAVRSLLARGLVTVGGDGASGTGRPIIHPDLVFALETLARPDARLSLVVTNGDGLRGRTWVSAGEAWASLTVLSASDCRVEMVEPGALCDQVIAFAEFSEASNHQHEARVFAREEWERITSGTCDALSDIEWLAADADPHLVEITAQRREGDTVMGSALVVAVAPDGAPYRVGSATTGEVALDPVTQDEIAQAIRVGLGLPA